MVTFINKDSTSGNVARSTPTERRLINEQSRGHRTSAREASERTRGRQRRPPNQSRSDHATYGESADPAARGNHSTSVSSSAIGTTGFCHSQLVHVSPLPTTTTTQPIPTTAVATITSHPCPAIGNPVNPFSTTSVPLTPTTLHLLSYYKQVYYTTLWSSVHTTLQSRTKTPIHIPRCTSDTVIHEAMLNRNRMYCLLADTGSHMTSISTSTSAAPILQSSQSNSQLPLHLLHLGTNSLRHELSISDFHVTNATLMGAMHLYLAAIRIQRHDAAQAHLKGVRAIVESILKAEGRIAVANVAVLSLVDVELAVGMLRGWEGEAMNGKEKGMSVEMGCDVGFLEELR